MTLPKRGFLIPTSSDVSKDDAATAFFEITAEFAVVIHNAEDVGGWRGEISGVTGGVGPVRISEGRRALLGRFEGAKTRAEETKSEKRQTPDRIDRQIMPLRSMTLIEVSVDQVRRVAKGDVPRFASTAVPSL